MQICDGVDHEDVNECGGEEHHRERTKEETAQLDLVNVQDYGQQVRKNCAYQEEEGCHRNVFVVHKEMIERSEHRNLHAS